MIKVPKVSNAEVRREPRIPIDLTESAIVNQLRESILNIKHNRQCAHGPRSSGALATLS
jgi:hypothetical protein